MTKKKIEKDPPFNPTKLRDYNDYDNKLKTCLEAIDDGLKVKEAVMYAFEIAEITWYKWNNHYEEDVSNGYTAKESRIIEFMDTVAKRDIDLKRKLTRTGLRLATDDENPDTDMLKYMLKHRAGYNSTKKSEVEVKGNANNPIDFNININKMKDKYSEN